MNIRKIEQKDSQEVLKMMRVFYDSDAVFHKASNEILKQNISDCIGDCPYIDGYVFEQGQNLMGYAMTAYSYSTEYGGKCLWIEDLYIKPEYRNQSIGSCFFDWLHNRLKDQIVRFRLEVEPENTAAVALYQKKGYHTLAYTQMTKEKIDERI